MLTFLVFLEDSQVEVEQLLGDSAILSRHVSVVLQESLSCRFPGFPGLGSSPAQPVIDSPFVVLLYCQAPVSAPQLRAYSQPLEVSLSVGGVSLSRTLCPVEAPSIRRRVAMCSQPLFMPEEPGSQKLFVRLLIEWIQYHHLFGVEKFYIFDRDDKFGEVMHPFEQQGIVHRYVWPIFNKTFGYSPLAYDQNVAQDTCLLRHRSTDEWLLFLDPDEFLHSNIERYNRKNGLWDFLDDYVGDDDVSEITLKNMVFGGSNSRNFGNYATVFSQYIRRSPEVEPGSREKFFARSATVASTWCHQVSQYKCGRKATPHPDVMRANHYVNAIANRGSGRTNDTSSMIEDTSMSWASSLVDARRAWPSHLWKQ